MNTARAPFLAVLAAVLAPVAAIALGTYWPLPRTPSTMVGTPGLAAKIDQGRHYFAMSCAHCHGDDATGDEGPNLHKLIISDAHIRLVVTNGIKGEMPTFAKKYDETQISAIAAYLRSLD